ncbi:hypothetical protein [Lactobacillus selangorensis]|uniref:hypothetical protein n=1 Tax=Lactobacillus selangorensis TaxID=81857 RepID=UPI0012E3842E|nr:hypothetical protein [Lactobacillus selangorensis]
MTLLETTIVLLIVCLMIGIPTIQWQHFTQVQAEKQFYQQFRHQWAAIREEAFMRNAIINLYYVPSKHAFVYRQRQMDGTAKPIATLSLPKTLTYVGGEKGKKKISLKRNMQPLTLQFNSSLTPKPPTHEFAVQMKWGLLSERDAP